MNYYRLNIECKADKSIYNSISKILGVTPDRFKPTKLFPIQSFDLWTYELEEPDDSEYIDFINLFLDLLESKFSQLKKLGVSKNDITIWQLYEYEHQCSMSFSPVQMKRLGDSGIHFNIDCWELK